MLVASSPLAGAIGLRWSLVEGGAWRSMAGAGEIRGAGKGWSPLVNAAGAGGGRLDAGLGLVAGLGVSAGRSWYVARVKSTISWEVTIAQLARQGFGAWLPLARSKQYFGGRNVIVEEPVFPGYLFVLFDVHRERWRAVNSSIGVVHLLPVHAEVPERLPPEFIDDLQNVNMRNREAVVELTKRYIENDIVRIITGPLASLPAARAARVVSSNANSVRVRIAHPTRGEIDVTVPIGAVDA